MECIVWRRRDWFGMGPDSLDCGATFHTTGLFLVSLVELFVYIVVAYQVYGKNCRSRKVSKCLMKTRDQTARNVSYCKYAFYLLTEATMAAPANATRTKYKHVFITNGRRMVYDIWWIIEHLIGQVKVNEYGAFLFSFVRFWSQLVYVLFLLSGVDGGIMEGGVARRCLFPWCLFLSLF